MMVLALKLKNPGKMDIAHFIAFSLNQFRLTEHTQPYEPAKIEISPADKAKLPEAFTVDIPVVTNKELEAGYLRVVTEDIPGLE